MIATPNEVTAEQLLGYDVPGKRIELVRGRLVVREPAGARHGGIGMRIAYLLMTHLECERSARGISAPRGEVFGPDTGVLLERDPDTVRAPDVAFVRDGRLPAPLPTGFGELAPDLVVEVRSPSDRIGPLLAKVGEWISAGTQVVWVVDPAHRVVTVYRADGVVTVLGAEDVLSGESLLPGFAVSVRELLPEG